MVSNIFNHHKYNHPQGIKQILIHASLACYATLEKSNLENLAQNMCTILSDPGQHEQLLAETEDDKLYFTDRGHKAEVLPESENKFFIHYPGNYNYT